MSEQIKSQLVALLPRLRRFAYTLTGSVDEGDDVVQSALERALGRLDQWQEGTRLDSWMFRIIQNISIDRKRARRVRGESEDPDLLAAVPGDDGRRTTEGVLTLEAVRRIVAELPEEQRTVLALVAIEGLSYREAADTLGVPMGTVTSRLARARQRIALRLELPPTK
jgi:RNA polymerase sigma-70 factor (ECF subfamily)